MGKKLSAPNLDLYRRVDEVLFYLWDPIGVNDVPGARDEYYSYLPDVFSMVKSERVADEIAEYLQNIASEAMGLSVSAKSLERDKKIALLLLEHKEWVNREQ